jgi:NADPH-dependent curcumin reductase CurA
MRTARVIRLKQRPAGTPTPADFDIVGEPLPELADNEVEAQTLLLSIDPYIRLTLDQAAPGSVIVGSGLARVTRSRDARFKEGDLVRHRAGQREAFVCSGATLAKAEFAPGLPLTAQLHALGGIGLCAYGGLFGVAKLQPGEQVFVSSAAGAVGSLAVQIAKVAGCYVVGSAGSDEKTAWLKEECGVDAAINYKTQPIREALAAVTPKGIDVYFENVGGAHLEAALARMNLNARIPVCGMISNYNGRVPITFGEELITKRLLIKGFGFTDFGREFYARFHADMTGWLMDGRVKFFETVLDGFERVPEALIGLFTGLNTGKMMVRAAS